MRVFSALPLPGQTSAALLDAFSAARALAPKAKWVTAEGMHLTLHFFGEIPEDAVPGFWPLFDDPALRRPAIVAQLGQVGFFPSSGTPRVLWIGLQKGVPEMREFFTAFTEKLGPLRKPGGLLQGWLTDSRGFTPHVTIARAGSTPLSTHWAEAVSVPAQEFLITECVLFQSILGSGGARYVPLKTIAFQRAAS
jgi:RNA 2',3'-cyclic 3'-phosphodiesterase